MISALIAKFFAIILIILILTFLAFFMPIVTRFISEKLKIKKIQNILIFILVIAITLFIFSLHPPAVTVLVYCIAIAVCSSIYGKKESKSYIIEKIREDNPYLSEIEIGELYA